LLQVDEARFDRRIGFARERVLLVPARQGLAEVQQRHAARQVGDQALQRVPLVAAVAGSSHVKTPSSRRRMQHPDRQHAVGERIGQQVHDRRCSRRSARGRSSTDRLAEQVRLRRAPQPPQQRRVEVAARPRPVGMERRQVGDGAAAGRLEDRRAPWLMPCTSDRSPLALQLGQAALVVVAAAATGLQERPRRRRGRRAPAQLAASTSSQAAV
jgi:hypothetical protein